MKHKTNRDAQKAIRQQQVVEDVLAERDRQDDQWGVQNHHPAYWLAILGKQVGQFGSAILNREWYEGAIEKVRAQQEMRAEAVQIAAVAMAAIECIDAGEMPVGLVTAKPSDPRQLAKALDHGHESIDYEKGADGVCSCSNPPETHPVSYHQHYPGPIQLPVKDTPQA